ncbi:MAG: glycosyltransferase [Flavobacterium sp.]|nr:glycosyltransferase [Flavobacterium sp.]
MLKYSISIIVAIHNGLATNKLFLAALQKYTCNNYQLIVIDNASTDGSRQFFELNNAEVIANNVNYSYPVCQNQGIEIANGDYLFFLNNDIIVSPGWDKHLIETAVMHNVDVISACGIENLGNSHDTKMISRRWKLIKNPFSAIGFTAFTLKLIFKIMYPNWEQFCENRFKTYHNNIVEGIVGNNVMITRRALEILGKWDERLQEADFDLYIRTKKRSIEFGDIKPCQISLGVFIHHFIRMTSKYSAKPNPFADSKNLIRIHEKWNIDELRDMHPDNFTLSIKENNRV